MSSITIPSTELVQRLNKRERVPYSEDQLGDIEDQQTIFLAQVRQLHRSRRTVIYENQEQVASEVVSIFQNRKILTVMVIAKTQSGKTGSMCATIRRLIQDTANPIPIDHIYIITGLSSKDWKSQTKYRMPDSIENRIFHQNELDKFSKDINGKKNVLIIMDEVQIAAKTSQIIYKTFKGANLLDKQYLYQNDIKIIEYTATPDGLIYDLMKWDDATRKVISQPGDNYVGSKELYEQGRIKQYKDLCGYNKNTGEVDPKVYENIRELKDTITSKYHTPRYHIIRTPSGPRQEVTMNNFRSIFNDTEYNYETYDMSSIVDDEKNNDINKRFLDKQPTKHTFIFIKEKLRCSITITKKFMGVLYERYTSYPDDAVIIQGIRLTGYDDNGDSICYTNIDTIKRYEQIWDTKFDTTRIRWTSKTTQYKHNILTGKDTYNHPSHYEISDSDEDDVKSQNTEPRSKPIIVISVTREIAKVYAGYSKPTQMSRAIALLQYKKPEEYDRYNTYKYCLWNMDSEDKMLKWGYESMVQPGAMSSTTNIHKRNRELNNLMIYFVESKCQFIYSPWNGRQPL